MMTNGEIVDMVIDQGIIDKALRLYYVHTSHRDDLSQEVCLILLTMDNERLNDINDTGKLAQFVTRIIRNQWCSKTSTYYSLYRKYEKKKASNEYNGIADADTE